MSGMKQIKSWTLIAAAAVLALCIAVALLSGKTVRAEDYAIKCDAAQRMRACMNAVKRYKNELGIPLGAEDWQETGMLGEEFTGITTTIGALEAKRTSANPNMAAMLVQMLEEAGVKRGDTVGAAFSGSFPSLNLATLAACQAMGVNVVYIASVGASMYGANQPELTFPDMLLRMAAEDLVPLPAALSLGGDWDCGMEMDPEEVEKLLPRLRTCGIPFLYEPDYQKNVELRMEIYQENGPISCFIGVGGNVTTIGRGEDTMPCGVVQPYYRLTSGEKSGLLEIYSAKGLPVLHVLDVKELTVRYGFPYDPRSPEPIGSGAIYESRSYPRAVCVFGIAAAAGLLAYGKYQKKREDAA